MSQPSVTMFCPFHKDSTTPNLHIYEDRGAYCFACGWSGSIMDVMVAHGYGGLDLLTGQKKFIDAHMVGVSGHSRSLNGVVRPTDGWVKYDADPSLFTYLIEKRRMLPDTIKEFGTNSWKGIIFGWESADDAKWVTRWWDGTYLYDPGFDRSSPFGVMGYADPKPGSPVVLVEGLLDAMRVFQSGTGLQVFATLGGPTQSQAQRLMKRQYKVLEMFDVDEGGDSHRRLLTKWGMPYITVKYGGGEVRDPADATDWDVRMAIETTLKQEGILNG